MPNQKTSSDLHDEAIAAIRAFAESLGEAPSHDELETLHDVSAFAQEQWLRAVERVTGVPESASLRGLFHGERGPRLEERARR